MRTAIFRRQFLAHILMTLAGKASSSGSGAMDIEMCGWSH
jgi:hypothetical protein